MDSPFEELLQLSRLQLQDSISVRQDGRFTEIHQQHRSSPQARQPNHPSQTPQQKHQQRQQHHQQQQQNPQHQQQQQNYQQLIQQQKQQNPQPQQQQQQNQQKLSRKQQKQLNQQQIQQPQQQQSHPQQHQQRQQHQLQDHHRHQHHQQQHQQQQHQQQQHQQQHQQNQQKLSRKQQRQLNQQQIQQPHQQQSHSQPQQQHQQMNQQLTQEQQQQHQQHQLQDHHRHQHQQQHQQQQQQQPQRQQRQQQHQQQQQQRRFSRRQRQNQEQPDDGQQRRDFSLIEVRQGQIESHHSIPNSHIRHVARSPGANVIVSSESPISAPIADDDQYSDDEQPQRTISTPPGREARNNARTKNNDWIEANYFERHLFNPFKNHEDIVAFLERAGKESADYVVSSLSNRDGGANRLLEIIQARISSDGVYNLNNVSFEDVILPLCRLLTKKDFRATEERKGLKYITKISLEDGDFLAKIYTYIKQMSSSAQLRESNPSCKRDGILNTCLPVLRITLLYLKEIDQSLGDPNLNEWLRLLGSLHQSEHANPKAIEITREIASITNMAISIQVRRTESPSVVVPRESIRIPAQDPTQGPGETRQQGPRHDNDHLQFRRITIMPTKGELKCEVPDYLPHLRRKDPFLQNPAEGYLDCLFRLTRSDFVTQIKEGFSFFEEKLAAVLLQDCIQNTLKGTNNNGQQVRLQLFQILGMEKPELTLWYGLNTKLKVAQLVDLQGKDKKDQDRFWKSSRGENVLAENTLAMVVSDATISKDHSVASYGSVQFCTIRKKECQKLARENMLEVETSLHDGIRISGSENENHKQRPQSIKKCVHLLVCFPKVFFLGYYTVLQRLQSLTPATLPLQNLFLDDSRSVLQNPPPDSPPGRFYVSCIFKDGVARPLPLSDYEALCATLTQNQENLLLDPSQIEAYSIAMTRQVSLIQGPPGTGKTYIGVKIVKSLIEMSERPARVVDQARQINYKQVPILCVCYTNHALDQFLEGIIDAGVSKESIIRIGSRSKSETLVQRNITEIQKQLPKVEKSQDFRLFFKKYKNLEDQVKAMQDITQLSASSILAQPAFRKSELFRDIFNHSVKNLITSDSQYRLALNTGQDANFQSIRISMEDSIFSSWLNGSSFQKAVETAVFNSNLVQSINSAAITPAWMMDRNTRKESILQVLQVSASNSKSGMDALMQEYHQIKADLDSFKARMCLNHLGQINVIGVTTSGAARFHQLLLQFKPKVLMCEEAGEVFESHVVCSLSKSVERLIMIGDHQQLRPKASTYALSVDCRNGYELDVSLFERLVSKHGAKPIETPANSGPPSNSEKPLLACLDEQRRMRPEISNLIRLTLYPSLKDSGAVTSHPNVKGMAHNLWFFNHLNRESSDGGAFSPGTASTSNKNEAEMAVQIVRYIIKQGYKPNQIAVITPYLGQMFLLRELLKKKSITLVISDADKEDMSDDSEDEGDEDKQSESHESESSDLSGDEGPSQPKDDQFRLVGSAKKQKPKKKVKRRAVAEVQRKNLGECVRLATVDNFQGEEADVVIVSTVRNNKEGRVGFLKISNRVNVMLSRARHGMYILGSAETIRSCRDAHMFHEILAELEHKGQIGPHVVLRCNRHNRDARVNKPSDFDRFAPDGGCDEPCGARLSCGHVCIKSCHPDDPDHLIPNCREKCLRNLKCGHICQKICMEKCGPCKHPVKVSKECGHNYDVKCYELESEKQKECQYLVDFEHPLCGHKSKIQCRVKQKITRFMASKPDQIMIQLDEDSRNALYSCKKRCQKQRNDCGHICNLDCGDCMMENLALSAPKDLGQFKHKGKCTHPCERGLVCGHLCAATPCHKAAECPPCKKECLVKCSHSKCKKDCNSICALCAMPCTWKCTNKHGESKKCDQLCGVPCEKLPCDERCEKNLKCGHRCPSICGEICPNPDYCRECGKHGKDIVDVLCQTSYEEWNLEESPVVVLDCGHLFTLESLDGWFKLTDYYEKNENGWSGLKALNGLEEVKHPHCYVCRAPVRSVRRYGRIVNHATLSNVQKRFVMKMDADLSSFSRNLHSLLGQTIPENASNPDQYIYLKKEAQKILNKASNLHKDYSDPPSRSIMQKNTNSKKHTTRTQTLNGSLQLFADKAYHHLMIKLDGLRLVTILAELKHLAIDEPKNSAPGPEAADKTRGTQRTIDPGLTTLQTSSSTKSDAPQKNIEDELDEWVKNYQTYLTNCLQNRLISTVQDLNYSACVGLVGLVDAFQFRLRLGKITWESGRGLQKKILSVCSHLLQKSEWKREHQEAIMSLLNHWNEVIKKAQFGPLTPQEMKAVFDAVNMTISGPQGGFGSRWNTCPNGHVYVIGECGGAMQTARCPECGATIGGTSHRLDPSNRPADDFVRQMQSL